METLPSPIVIETAGSHGASILSRSPQTGYSLLHSDLSSLSVVIAASIFPANTVDPRSGVVKVAMDQLCELVEANDVLRTARIVSCATYASRGFIVTHRFVIMKLRRIDRKDTYLRIDRRPASRSRLFRGMGTTPSNDEVSLYIETRYKR